MNRRDFTKTVAALCCLPGVKLQDRTIVDFNYVYNDTPGFNIALTYLDGSIEKYRSNVLHYTPNPSKIDKLSDIPSLRNQNIVSVDLWPDDLIITYQDCTAVLIDIKKVS